MHLLDSGYDWDYPVEPQEKGNSFMRHARAKVLGGCSSHNSCIAFWPPREDLDEWAAMGATGWSAAECCRSSSGWRTTTPPATTTAAAAGELRTSRPTTRAAWPSWRRPRRRDADRRVQRGRDRDQRRGLVPDQLRRGRHPDVELARVPASDPGHRRNLEVRTRLLGQQILFDDAAPRHRRPVPAPDLSRIRTVIGRREVIVTAGAIDTPKLLMLSGIGPGVHLREIGIDVRVDSPGVGANLDDHVEGLVFWEAPQADGDDVDPVVGDRVVHDHASRAWTGPT